MMKLRKLNRQKKLKKDITTARFARLTEIQIQPKLDKVKNFALAIC